MTLGPVTGLFGQTMLLGFSDYPGRDLKRETLSCFLIMN
jgi:hypothetical protein